MTHAYWNLTAAEKSFISLFRNKKLYYALISWFFDQMGKYASRKLKNGSYLWNHDTLIQTLGWDSQKCLSTSSVSISISTLSWISELAILSTSFSHDVFISHLSAPYSFSISLIVLWLHCNRVKLTGCNTYIHSLFSLENLYPASSKPFSFLNLFHFLAILRYIALASPYCALFDIFTTNKLTSIATEKWRMQHLHTNP